MMLATLRDSSKIVVCFEPLIPLWTIHVQACILGKSGSAVDKSIGPESLTTKDSVTEPETSTDQIGRSPVTGTVPSSGLQSIINTIAPVIGFGSSTSGGQEPRSNDGLYDTGNAPGELIRIS